MITVSIVESPGIARFFLLLDYWTKNKALPEKKFAQDHLYQSSIVIGTNEPTYGSCT